MDGKYIIILLFIFLVFLMGSINSTVTNNFYNNTTGSQDHAALSNLSYADSNHTGFQSSDSLDNDVEALGYVTDEYHDTEKVNKSGDTMTGFLNGTSMQMQTIQMVNASASVGFTIRNVFTSPTRYSTNAEVAQGGAFRFMNNYNESAYQDDPTLPTMIMRLRASSGGTVSFGYIPAYTTTYGQIYLMEMSSSTNDTVFGYGNVTISKLAGSGNAYDCLDSAGTHYRGSPTC